MKRILHVFLAIAVLMVAYGENITTFASEKPESTEEIDFLSSIGILSNSDEYKAESEITRQQAAKIIVKCLGVDIVEGNTVTPFSDVAPDNPYSGYILSAYKLGLMSGYGDGTFKPENKITYNQALKMLVTATGYSVYAEHMGGYPSGYLAIGDKCKIIKGTAIIGEAAITVGEMAKLLQNALNINIVERANYGSDSLSFDELDNITLLSKYHSIYKHEGLVTGTYETSFVSDRKIRSGEVAIEGRVFSAGATNAEEYLCQYVTAYVKEDNDDGTILYIIGDKRNERVAVNSDDILAKTKKNAFWYEGDNRDCLINISDDAVLIYNGITKHPWNSDDLMPEQGEVVLISPKGNECKYIFVNEYETKVVDYVDVLNKTVHFKGGEQIVIDTDKENVKTIFVELNGKNADLNFCYEWDIFTIIKSLDGKVIKIIRSEKFVSGKVTGIGDGMIDIDGVTYSVTDSLMSDTVLNPPTLNMEGDFYFDYAGRVAAVDVNASKAKNYGYLVAASYKEGLSSKVEFKIFTSEGEMKTFAVGEYLKVNGIRVKRDAISTGASSIYTNGEAVRQLISYDVNEDGTLAEVITAKDYIKDFDNPDRLNSFSKDFYIDEKSLGEGTGGKVIFIPGNIKMFASRFMIKDSTVIFIIPKKDADDKEYAIKPVGDLYFASVSNDKYERIGLFDIDSDYVISAMVWDSEEEYERPPIHSDTVAYVSDIVKGMNDNGENVVFIKGIDEKGKEIKVYAENDFDVYYGKALTDMNKDEHVDSHGVLADKVKITDIKVGDIIQYKAKITNELTLLNVLFRAETPAEYEKWYDSYKGSLADPGKNGYYVCMRVGYGEVVQVLKYGVLVKVKDRINPSIEYMRLYPYTGKIILKERNKSELVTSNRLLRGDKVASIINTTEMDMLVIYR